MVKCAIVLRRLDRSLAGRDLRCLYVGQRLGRCLAGRAYPISEDAIALNDHRSALDHAITDGEDHELLFTIFPDSRDAFIATWHEKTDLTCACIGEVNDNEGVGNCIANDGSVSPISDHGFSHFRS